MGEISPSTREPQSDPQAMVRQRIDKLAQYCKEHLAREARPDEFGDDFRERREARKQKNSSRDPEAIAADRRNKLRISNISPILAGFESLDLAFEKLHDTGPLHELVHNAIQELPDPVTLVQNYESMAFEEKLETAKQIDRIAQSFLNTLQQQPPSEK